MGNVANSLQRGQQHLHRNHSHPNNKGKTGRPWQTKTNASANATSKPIICYNCSEKDHISPNCPHAKNFKRIPTKNGTTTAKSWVATTTNSTEYDNAIVCSARVINYAHNSTDIQLEHDDTVRATDFPNISYENDVDLTAFLNCSTYSTVWIEKYNHFNTPGDSDPKIEAFMHDCPMEKDLISVATIFELNHNDTISKACRQIVKEGAMPVIQKIFVPKPWDLPIQFQLWLETIRFLIRHKLLELQYMKANMYLTVTNTDSGLQLTFHPIGAIKPTLHLQVATNQYFLTQNPPSLYAQAAMVKIENSEKKDIKSPQTQRSYYPRNRRP
jgi:hypothetical protein